MIEGFVHLVAGFLNVFFHPFLRPVEEISVADSGIFDRECKSLREFQEFRQMLCALGDAS